MHDEQKRLPGRIRWPGLEAVVCALVIFAIASGATHFGADAPSPPVDATPDGGHSADARAYAFPPPELRATQADVTEPVATF